MEQGEPPDGRPGRPWRGRPPRDVALLLGAAALVVAFWLLVRLRSLLVLLLISFFLSFAIEPPVNLLARRGWRRGPATGVAFGAVIAGGSIMGPIGSLLALPAAASVQSLVSIYLHRYEVIASPLTGAPEAAAVPASQPPPPGLG